MENLREGLVAVRVSRGFKKQFRTPWTRALIVKVYGRSVTLSFLHNRLLSMWKPTGRLDCVDLGHGFFLTRFYLRDDYEATLKKGPWFIGEHFLSIRPWEPNFHSASANVTSVAIWIRFNELSIEYYNSEALLQIGKAIGNVLRVDTHTANEARGRFARLCVQVDVDKPLVTAVLIGKFEQPVCYEGIQKLCFSCGKMGHRKEGCPFVVRPDPMPRGVEEMNGRDAEGRSPHAREEHAAARTTAGEGPSSVVHGSAHEEAQEGPYGPWIVVTRKRNVTKNQKSGGTPTVLDNGRLREEQRKVAYEAKMKLAVRNQNSADGPGREVKRKNICSKSSLEAQIVSSIQSVKQGSSQQAQGASFRNQVTTEILQVDPRVERVGSKSQQKNNASVKGKKAIARARVSLEDSASAEKDKAISSLSHKYSNIQKLYSLNIPQSRVQTSYVQPSQGGESKQKDEESSSPRALAEFQFTSGSLEEMGYKHGRDHGNNRHGASGDSCEFNSGDGLDQRQAPSNCGVQSSWVAAGNGDGCDVAQHHDVSERGPNEGDAKADRMELEGGGEIPTTG